MAVSIAAIPFQPKLGQVPENLQKIEEQIDSALERQCKTVLFPELASCGYLLENLVAEAAVSAKDSLFDGIRKKSRFADICLGAVLRDGHRHYNAALFFRDGDLYHIHKKIYLPTYGMFDEGRYFTPGESLRTFDSALGKTAILICEDAWHPALVYAAYSQKVENVLILSASPDRGLDSGGSEPDSFGMWESRLLVYAQSFGCRFIYLNLGGVEDGIRFGGRVIIASPLLVEKEWKREDIVYTTIENEELTRAALLGGPFQEENFALNARILKQSLKIRAASDNVR